MDSLVDAEAYPSSSRIIGGPDPIGTCTTISHHNTEDDDAAKLQLIPSYTTTTQEESLASNNNNNNNNNNSNDTNSSNIDDDNSQESSLALLPRFLLYFRSNDGKELGAVLLLTGLIVTLSFTTFQQPETRPIPHQTLNIDNTTHYILDQQLNHVSPGDSISDALIAVLAIVVCPVIQFLATFGTQKGRWIDAHKTTCIYLLALSTNDCLTFMFKAYVAMPRPNFYQDCQPSSTMEYCTNDSHLLGIPYHSGSFPSGHASTSFCGMTLLALYIHHRFGMRSKRVYVQQDSRLASYSIKNGPVFTACYIPDSSLLLARLASLVALVPIFVALWIAASRVRDNKHFPADVLAGALIGSGLAHYAHGMWFV